MNYDEDYIDENSLWLVIKSLRHVANFKVFLKKNIKIRTDINS